MSLRSNIYEPRLLITYGTLVLIIIRVIIILLNKKNNKPFNLKTEVLFDSFVIYILLVLSITLLPITIYEGQAPYEITPAWDLIPFNGLNLKDIFDIITLENIFGNMFLMTPLVIFLRVIYKNRFNNFKKCILIVFIFSLSIECCQYLEMYFQISHSRISDITDIILNCLGGFIGYFISNIFLKNKCSN